MFCMPARFCLTIAGNSQVVSLESVLCQYGLPSGDLNSFHGVPRSARCSHVSHTSVYMWDEHVPRSRSSSQRACPIVSLACVDCSSRDARPPPSSPARRPAARQVESRS
jgi:hypothetical protein